MPQVIVCVYVFANAYTFVTHSSKKSKCVHIYKQCVRCITCMQVCEYLNVFLCVCVYATSNCLCLFVHVFANAYAFVTHFSNMSKWVHIHYQCRMYKLYTIYMYVCEYKGVTMCVYVCYKRFYKHVFANVCAFVTHSATLHIHKHCANV